MTVFAPHERLFSHQNPSLCTSTTPPYSKMTSPNIGVGVELQGYIEHLLWRRVGRTWREEEGSWAGGANWGEKFVSHLGKFVDLDLSSIQVCMYF